MLGVGIRYTVGTEIVLSPSNFCIGQKRDKIDTMGRVVSDGSAKMLLNALSTSATTSFLVQIL
jgi:hypothetical protein